jgi:hypothetical protein
MIPKNDPLLGQNYWQKQICRLMLSITSRFSTLREKDSPREIIADILGRGGFFLSDETGSERSAIGGRMKTRILLAGILVIASGALPVHSEDQACRGGCIKAWNACITQCGGATATLPGDPVSKDRLTHINDCVRSQCQQSLGSCETGCRKQNPSR